MPAADSRYSQGSFRCLILTQSNYLAWSNILQIQMIAKRCWKRVNTPQPPPTPPTLLNGDTIESHIEKRRMEREYREDQEAYEQRSGAATAIIYATISPAAEAFVKGV